jgi:SAM-dependent methyltransferase
MSTELQRASQESQFSEHRDTAATPSRPIRRGRYSASILRGDFFVLRNLKSFLEQSLRRWVQAGVTVADVGCGEQPLRSLVEGLGGEYTGVDVVQNRQGTVDVTADITKIPLPRDSFGLVLCTEVLEHIPDTSAAVAELKRLCRPGGAIIITTPFTYPLHEEPYDFVRLTPHLLQRLAIEHSLEIYELTTLGDELQVAATVWCNLWTRGSGPRGRLRSAWNLIMRLPVNLVVLGLAPLQKHLPRKFFLNTCCILLKS